jgi:molybdopterin converting factor small subunit
VNVRFSIPGPLSSLTGGKRHVDVDVSGSTLRDAFEALFSAYPGVRDRIVTERSEIRQHVNVFVGNSEVRTMDGLATPLVGDVEISIIPAISGGLGSTGRRTGSHMIEDPGASPGSRRIVRLQL